MTTRFIKIILDLLVSSVTTNQTKKIKWPPRHKNNLTQEVKAMLCTLVTFILSAQCPIVSLYSWSSYRWWTTWIRKRWASDIWPVAWNNLPWLIYIHGILRTFLFRANIQGEQQQSKLKQHMWVVTKTDKKVNSKKNKNKRSLAYMLVSVSTLPQKWMNSLNKIKSYLQRCISES